MFDVYTDLNFMKLATLLFMFILIGCATGDLSPEDEARIARDLEGASKKIGTTSGETMQNSPNVDFNCMRNCSAQGNSTGLCEKRCSY